MFFCLSRVLEVHHILQVHWFWYMKDTLFIWTLSAGEDTGSHCWSLKCACSSLLAQICKTQLLIYKTGASISVFIWYIWSMWLMWITHSFTLMFQLVGLGPRVVYFLTAGQKIKIQSLFHQGCLPLKFSPLWSWKCNPGHEKHFNRGGIYNLSSTFHIWIFYTETHFRIQTEMKSPPVRHFAILSSKSGNIEIIQT